MNPTLTKTILTIIGGALVAAAPTLPPPWGIVASTIGGLLGGGALFRRPGDAPVPK